MKRALKIQKQRLKELAEKLFPQATYDRRYRIWLKTEPELQLLSAICPADAIAIDIGANEGFFSEHLLRISRKVVAFEPLPQMLTRLRARYSNRMEIVGVALSDHPGEGVLRYPAGGYMTATIADSNVSAMQSGSVVETAKAPMRTLDSYQLTNVGFIKIDVEGHEEAVLHGGLETLRREMPNLMIEIEERHASGSLSRVSNLLSELGYSGFYLTRHALLPLKEFDSSRDQRVDGSKTGEYINNFLFFPNGSAERVLTDARLCLQNAAQTSGLSPVAQPNR
jgi:FkbM family methyltransferase